MIANISLERYRELEKIIDETIPELKPQVKGQKPLTPLHWQLLEDEHQIICNHSGRRALKTLLFSRKLFKKALQTRGRYICGAPTHEQAREIFWDRMCQLTTLFQSRKPHETYRKIFLTNGSEIHIAGLESGERLKGKPAAGFHISEVDDVKEEVWFRHFLPMSLDTDAFFYLDGVPGGGLGWFHDICLKACDGAFPERDEKKGGKFHASKNNPNMAYYHWFSSDVYEQWKLDLIQEQYIYSQDMFDREFLGAFISLLGAAYKNYGAWNIQKNDYNPLYVVHIGMDFNRNPMAVTFSHIVNGHVYVFDEALISDCTTQDMIDYILIDRKFEPLMCVIYPDSTGKAEKSNASKSDIAQLRAAGLEVKAKSSNPRIRDRISNVNRLLKDRKDITRVHIDPRCRHLINDFNKVKCDQYGREEAEQKKGRLTHISSAFGYMCYYLFPMYKGRIELAY